MVSAICRSAWPRRSTASTTDASKRGAPVDHIVPVRDVILSAGAEFVVAVCGDIMRMPGLPKVPSADFIKLDEKGQIQGLF